MDFKNMTREAALEIAFPIMNYAYDNEMYKLKTVKNNRSEELNVSIIGVAIINKREAGREGVLSVSRASGYRVALSLDEIKLRKESLSESKQKNTVPESDK